MTDNDDRVSAQYRALAREEPTPELDAKILAAARARGARPGRASRWAGPVSIAAVLVLGIGVSLRMQLEQPGIETSAPAATTSAEYPIASDTAVEAPQPKAVEARPGARPERQDLRERKDEAARQAPPRPAEKAKVVTPKADANRLADQPAQPREAAVASSPPPALAPAAPMAFPPPAPAASTAVAPEPVPAPQPKRRITESVRAESARAAAPASAPAPMAAPPAGAASGMRLKKEAGASDNALAAEPEADPGRELERIATLRAAGRDAEANRALDEFRRRHPGVRISEEMWERVRQR